MLDRDAVAPVFLGQQPITKIVEHFRERIEQLEEAAYRQSMWNSARVAGWLGLILIFMLIVVLVEALQNKPLSFSY